MPLRPKSQIRQEQDAQNQDRRSEALGLRAGGLLVSGFLGLLGLLGCKELTGSQPFPAGTHDPAFYQTRAGALGMRTAALYQLEQQALPSVVYTSGLLTDELASNETGASQGVLLTRTLPPEGSVDERILPDVLPTGQAGVSSLAVAYQSLQGARASLTQAVGALRAYDTTAESAPLRSELYALTGYTEILLADLFCSGVPLSTLDFQKDFTNRPGSTTAAVYQAALAALDTAAQLAPPDSAGLQHLIAVLRGRAYLALGDYTHAGQAASGVPDGFQYQLAVQWSPASQGGTGALSIPAMATVGDQEGVNGLPFVSSQDPRLPLQAGTANNGSTPVSWRFPAKYALDGSFSPFPVADWIEARLIQAEAALQVRDTATWLATLNYLRANAQVPQQTGPLMPLMDPGTDSARVSLTFAERADWLFLTGHRQGDLRRLIRQYHRRQEQVYPSGLYLAPGAGQYGADVTAPIPQSEYANPLFHGCLNRDA